MSFRPIKAREYGSTKAVVGALIDAAGGAKGAAFVLGRGLSQTYGYADEAVPDAQIFLDQARRLAAHSGSPALAQTAARDVGGYFTPADASEDTVNQLMAKGETARGKFLADFLRGLDRDGAANAGPDTLALLDDCLATLATLRARISV